MKGLKISEAIESLEELKKNYGDVRVMTCVPYTYDEKDHIERIEIGENNHGIVAVIW